MVTRAPMPPMADVQPPEGLRKILADAYDHHATTVYPQRTQPGRWSWACRCGAKSYGETYEAIELAHVPARNHFADAVLAALFEACEVREEWGVRSGEYDLFSSYTRKEVERVIAEEAADGNDSCQMIRRCVLSTPAEPVSSTGEEPTDGAG